MKFRLKPFKSASGREGWHVQYKKGLRWRNATDYLYTEQAEAQKDLQYYLDTMSPEPKNQKKPFFEKQWRVRKVALFGFDPVYLVEFKPWWRVLWAAYDHYEYPTKIAAEEALKRAMVTPKRFKK